MKPHHSATVFLLCLLLLFPLFSACAKETDGTDMSSASSDTLSPETKTHPEETGPVFLPDSLPEADFDGYMFNIVSCYFIGHDSAHLVMFEEITGDPVNDKLFETKCAVEERFNVHIGMIDALTTYGAYTMFRTSVSGGDHAFDIIIGHDKDTTRLGKDGLCLNLRSIPSFDMDKPWWPPHAVNALSIGDKLYTASSYLSYLGLHWTRVITFNKTMAENLHMPLPYDDVREGTWTLDKFHSLFEDVSYDVNGNGKFDHLDEIGLTSGDQTWYCLQEAVGLAPYKRDEYGIPYLDLDIERTQKYVETMRKMLLGGDYIADGMFGVDVFKQGHALFAYTQIGDAYDTYRLTDVKYGFLPTPKLDERQEEYINCCTDMPWAMPKTVMGDDLTAAASVIEALSCQNYNYVLPVYQEGALKARIADAPDDSEMLGLIADTRIISFAYTFEMPFHNIVADCVLGNQEVSSYFKRSEKAAGKALEKLLACFENAG